MKRHPELLTLSREHHAALKLARHARLAAESGASPEIARLARQAVDTFARELEPHFQTEEADLLPLLQRAGQHALVERTLDDHRRLRQLGQQLNEPDAATLLAFAELLAEHVRFEERELFETAQNYLPPTP
jgi:hemerythrin-like domain-containing protein